MAMDEEEAKDESCKKARGYMARHGDG